MHKKNTNEVQEMLFSEHSINWNDYPVHIRRGTGVRKEDESWVIDLDIPIFTKDREYITSMYKIEEVENEE